MAKKQRTDDKSRSTLWVIGEDGERQRFLRGVATHYLMQRGFDFDDAYATARALRDRLSSNEEVSKDEIRDTLTELVETTFGSEATGRLRRRGQHVAAPSRLTVRSGSRRQPFSRGLLATSLHAAGLDFDRAYGLVVELEGELRREQIETLNSDDLARRAGDLLERSEGRAAAERFRSVRRLRRLPRPLIVYVGGASGTGKSTLALELAPLLRIYRVTATDTIRQVMRSLISPQILPAIHSSSFESIPAGLELDEDERDPMQALIASFIEQATRLQVGVRAVVERAITENASALIEGVHLAPPVVPFPDLDGACYQVPLVLGISDLEAHRSRFLTRTSRQASRYVERFGAIRHLHDFIIDRAENEGISFLDTSHGQAAPRALRLVLRMLQEKWPSLAADRDTERPPALLLALDGLADVPNRALGGRTPLEAAETPMLDRLAREGVCGLADPIKPGVVPDTAAGTLALLGQAPTAAQRGPVEAVGAGFRLESGDVALRANFATVEDGQILDRRAGRIREGAAKLIAALDGLRFPGQPAKTEIRVAAGTEHRLAIILRGTGLSSAIRGSDPGGGGVPGPPLIPKAINEDDPEAVFTAQLLLGFEQAAHEILQDHPVNRKRQRKGLPPANTLLTRGAGRYHRLAPLEVDGRGLRIACIAGDRTVSGIASWLDADLLRSPTMTANLDTDLAVKFQLAQDALQNHELVVLHVKGADIAAHDRQPDRKAAFIEKIDRELGVFLDEFDEPLRVLVGSDHATSSESGHHTADPVPVLIWGPGVEADEIEAFSEGQVVGGQLGRFPLQRLLGRLLDLG